MRICGNFNNEETMKDGNHQGAKDKIKVSNSIKTYVVKYCMKL